MSGWTVLVATHAFAASIAIPLGGYQLFRTPKGDLRHRVVGRVWAAAMLYVAVTSFWIRDLRDGRLSLLHVLSVVTLVSVVLGVASARAGRIEAHKQNMRGAWFGVLGAFVGAVAVPQREIPTFVVTDPVGAAGALLAVAVTTAAVLGLARLAERVARTGRGPGTRVPAPAAQPAPARPKAAGR
jgi:uncharacterized membrane protein